MDAVHLKHFIRSSWLNWIINTVQCGLSSFQSRFLSKQTLKLLSLLPFLRFNIGFDFFLLLLIRFDFLFRRKIHSLTV